jgi:hypothetical protein
LKPISLTVANRYIPPPADLVVPIDAIKEYSKTLVAAGDPRECWRLLEYLFELPFFHLINAPAPLALLEPKQTPRKVLQAARRLKDAIARLPEDKRLAIEREDQILADNARIARESRLNAREAAKRKAIIHEEALLDHDALDLEKRFLELDAKRRRTTDAPLIVQVNCAPTQTGLPAKERVLVEGTFTGPPGPHATTIGKITARLRAERALEERIARTGAIRTGILTPPVTPLPPLPTPEELHVPSTENLPATPAPLPSTPRRPRTEAELVRSLTKDGCTLRPVVTRIDTPIDKPSKGKSLRKNSKSNVGTPKPGPSSSSTTEAELESLRIKIITPTRKEFIRAHGTITPRSKTPDSRKTTQHTERQTRSRSTGRTPRQRELFGSEDEEALLQDPPASTSTTPSSRPAIRGRSRIRRISSDDELEVLAEPNEAEDLVSRATRLGLIDD